MAASIKSINSATTVNAGLHTCHDFRKDLIKVLSPTPRDIL